MHKKRPLGFAGLRLVALVWPALVLGAPATTTEILGRLPMIEMVSLSPNGQLLAFVRTDGDTRVAEVYSFEQKAVTSAHRVSGQKLRSIQWADDEHLIVETSVTTVPGGLIGRRGEWFLGQSINVTKKHVVALDFQIDGLETMNVLASPVTVRNIKGKTVIFAEGFFVANRQLVNGLFTFDPETGRTTKVGESYANQQDWLIGEDGSVLALLECDTEKKRWTLRAPKGGRLAGIATGELLIDIPRLAGLTDDPNVAVMTLREDEVWHDRRVSLANGEFLGEYEPGVGTDRLITDRLTPKIIAGHDDESEQTQFLDPAIQGQWATIVKALDATHVSFEGSSDDRKLWVVRASSQAEGYGYHLFDLAARRGKKVTDVYPGIPTIAERKAYQYEARDGLQIPGVLTLPPDRKPEKLPLVVLAHGGPASLVTTKFDWWAEAYALEGYAVLEPNFRGSTISGSHVKAGFGEWGRKMQTDLSDGVRSLVKDGIVDPQRVCIVGGSYGGYAAMAGPTLDPGIYRCAAAIAGLSDLARFLRWENGYRLFDESQAQRYWNRFIGVSGPDDPLLKTISPAQQATNVTVPMLLIHGKDDTVVPYAQSEYMRDALTKAGKSVELVTLKAEDHWLSRSATRSQMLEATVSFLKKNNPTD